MARKTWRGLVPACVVAVAGIAAPAIAPHALWSAALYDAATLAAAGVALAGALRLAPARRRPWLLVAGACACFFVGNVLWDVYEHALHIDAPLPSAADVAYLAAYPLLLLALLDLIKTRTRVSRISAVLDAGVLAFAGALVLWEPLLLDAGHSVSGALVAGAYPVGDLAVIGLCLILLGAGRVTRANLVLVAGPTILVVADITYLVLESHSTYSTGGWPDPLFVVAPFVLALAPWADRASDASAERRAADPRSSLAATLVVVASLVALPIDFGLTAGGTPRPYETPVRVGLRLFLVAFVGARLMRQTMANQRLVANLDRSRTRLQMVVNNTVDAVVFTSEDGTVLEWNRAAEQLFNIPRSRALGSNALDYFTPPPDIAAAFDAQDGRGHIEATRPMRLNGRTVPVWFQIAPVLDDNGLVGYVSVARDDTTRLVARDAHRTFATLDPERAVRRFAGELTRFVAFDSLSLSSIAGDQFRELARVRRVQGTDPAEFVIGDPLTSIGGNLRDFGLADIGRPYSILTRADYGDRIDASRANAVIVLPLRHSDSDAVHGVLTVGFNDPAGATVADAEALARVAPDIAQAVENMLLYEQQLEAADQLRELNDLRDAFLAMIAHEVRGPLNAIGAAAGVLSRHRATMDEDAASDMLSGIATSAQHLSRLTGDLLDASRAGDDRFPCAMRPIDDLGSLVGGAARSAAGDRHERLHVHTPDRIAITGDADRIAQVVRNLVFNALKYTDGPVEVGVTRRDDQGLITVVDHGAGIAPEDAHRLFERYARFGAPGTRSAAGTGLGLFITRELVLAHGGTIAHHPTPGGGATFAVALPV